MESSFTIRVPRWLVFVLAALLLVGGGIGAGLAFGGGGGNANADVAAERKPTTSTSTQPSTTTSTVPFAGFPGAASSGNGGNEGAGGGGAGAAQAPNPAQPPAPPAATASVSKSANCPTVVSWNGTGGTNGYTLQVYNAVPGGATLYNGPAGANGQMNFNCAGAAPMQVPVVGLVRFNTNTATGTVSDTA